MTELIFKLISEGKIYLFFYLSFFLLVVFETKIKSQSFKNLVLFFLTVLLILFSGLRWETGTDWESYKELFDSLELDWTFLLNVYSFDLGYVILNALIKFFTSNYSIFLLIDSIIAISLVYVFLKKKSQNPLISFFVFYNAFFVAQFMGSNRRMISLGAGLFLLYYVYNHNFKKYSIWQLIAFLFHRSSILLAIAWFVPKKRFSSSKIFIILGLSIIIGIPQIPFKTMGYIGEILSSLGSNPFIDKMIYYYENNEAIISENTNPIIMLILSSIKRLVFIIFYLIIIMKQKMKLDGLTDYFFNIYIIGFAIYLLFNGSPIFQMLSTYFTFIEVVLIGRFWAYCQIKNKIMFMFILFFYGFFQLLSSLAAYPDLYIPYQSFLRDTPIF